MGETETATIVVSIVGAAVGIIGVLGLMLRILTTNIAREFQALGGRIDETNRRIDDVKTELGGRIEDVKTELGGRTDETNRRIEDVKTELGGRIDETNRRIDDLKTELGGRIDETNRRIDDVKTDLAENRERMAKLEGALDGFLAGRRDRDAA